jgi:hypothetical protein
VALRGIIYIHRRDHFMRTFALVGLLAASVCWAQEPASNPQELPSQVGNQAPAASQTITIPAGTRIPLALVSQITSKARSGDDVRAVTTFPVTVGSQMAIPVGTFLEGVIDKVKKGGRSGPSLQMHFTRILYANGYSVPIEGNNTQAKALPPEGSFREASAIAGEGEPNYVLAAQHSPGPSKAVAIGITVGVAAAGAVAVVLLTRHAGGGIDVLFDTGWQFEMVLQAPLSVDAASVAAGTPNKS